MEFLLISCDIFCDIFCWIFDDVLQEFLKFLKYLVYYIAASRNLIFSNSLAFSALNETYVLLCKISSPFLMGEIPTRTKKKKEN